MTRLRVLLRYSVTGEDPTQRNSKDERYSNIEEVKFKKLKLFKRFVTNNTLYTSILVIKYNNSNAEYKKMPFKF